MTQASYLLDTHALIFWSTQSRVSGEFISFFDDQAIKGRLLISSISFWEMALLVKVKKLYIKDVYKWQNELLNSASLTVLPPTITDMIDSTLLPDHHRDPFDRLLIAQARAAQAVIVTKDDHIKKYKIQTVWM